MRHHEITKAPPSHPLLVREISRLVVAMLAGHGVRIVRITVHPVYILVCIAIDCPDIYKVGNRSGVRYTIKFTQELLLARAHTITDIVCLGTSLTNRIENFSATINYEIITEGRVMTLYLMFQFLLSIL